MIQSNGYRPLEGSEIPSVKRMELHLFSQNAEQCLVGATIDITRLFQLVFCKNTSADCSIRIAGDGEAIGY